MATWTLAGTGLPLSVSGANLNGAIPLVGEQPGDFNPEAISEIRVFRTMTISGLVDDSVNESTGCMMENINGERVFQAIGGSLNHTSDGTFPATILGSVGLYRPTPTGNRVLEASFIGWWAEYVANMKNDMATVSITALTMEIDYTPGAPPVASFTKDKTTVYTGQQIQFTDTSTGGVTSRSWDFGGGASGSTDQNPLVTFNTPGVFNVTVTVTNAFGQDTSAPQQITVLKREAEVWNGAAWVGGESWNGVAWVVPEVWDGVQWIPVKAP
jgi:hypothetical protein